MREKLTCSTCPASEPKDSDRYKVANCTQPQPFVCGSGRMAHGKVISVSVLRDTLKCAESPLSPVKGAGIAVCRLRPPIRHAAPGAVGALPVAVVEPSFGTSLMAGLGGSNRPPTPSRPAPWGAVGMAAVARRADREESVTVSTGLLVERLVHGVGARGAVSDWTTGLNRGTTTGTGSVCRSSGRSRGPGRHNRALTPRLSPLSTLPERRAGRQRRGLWTPPLPMDAKNTPTGSLENREERGFPQRPQPSSSSSSRSTREDRVPGSRASTSVENPSGFDDH